VARLVVSCDVVDFGDVLVAGTYLTGGVSTQAMSGSS
jgi:hypothetical protein